MTGGAPKRALVLAAAVATVAIAAFVSWRVAAGSDAAIISGRLHALVDLVNEPVGEGLSATARAVEIGSYFDPDVTVDLGQGTSPIRGRDMLMGMLTRLQPRTVAYRLALNDVTARVHEDGASADVALTGTVNRRVASADEAREAREFALLMTKTDGAWRIARLTAVETLR